ncbi:hypothetical protein [Aromatoleum petrolei]|uniref:P pilus assembly protein, chaperone PapD n=1 Tax=Aromatoleum petrolei TaxID=76116 RepID=A0ABX1MJJ8_9RHOO|nr:hypothetical protein [Aromatoleum petrolei]NMF88130.1 hypothetical protein [Aromatoleum petrolei]QTQ38920.1 Uncharacterized protein ToN1_48260 [Aromatoleum petrolei]
MARLSRTIRAWVAVVCLLSAAAQAGINVEGTLSEERIAHAGETYRGTLVIRNPGPEPVEVKLYQTDYRFDAEGRNDYAEPGSLVRSNARWIRLGQPQFRIAPGQTVHAPYEVRVPEDARLKGTYWSMVMVEPLSRGESVSAPKERAVQLAQVVRFAVQIVTQIGQGTEPELAFARPMTVVKDGRRLFSVDVANNGERWIRSRFWLELYTYQGRPQAKIDGEKHRIYPGTSVRARFDISDVPPGQYRALIVADGEKEDLYGTELKIEIH